jgi:hypothetical protein
VFVAYKNIVCTLKWPSLKAKIGKTKKSSLVGLTPGQRFALKASQCGSRATFVEFEKAFWCRKHVKIKKLTLKSEYFVSNVAR